LTTRFQKFSDNTTRFWRVLFLYCTIKVMKTKNAVLLVFGLLIIVLAIWWYKGILDDADTFNMGKTNSNSQITTGSVSDWKTYTNTQYGFTFKYPSSWPTPKTDEVSVWFGESTAYDYTEEKLEVSVAEQGTKTLEQFIKDEAKLLYKVSYQNLNNTTLDGSPAVSFIEQRNGGFFEDALYVSHGDNVYKLRYGNRMDESDYPDSLRKEIQTLLSTFHFTK
jgi:hypothetical protein